MVKRTRQIQTRTSVNLKAGASDDRLPVPTHGWPGSIDLVQHRRGETGGDAAVGQVRADPALRQPDRRSGHGMPVRQKTTVQVRGKIHLSFQ